MITKRIKLSIERLLQSKQIPIQLEFISPFAHHFCKLTSEVKFQIYILPSPPQISLQKQCAAAITCLEDISTPVQISAKFKLCVRYKIQINYYTVFVISTIDSNSVFELIICSNFSIDWSFRNMIC